MYWEQLTSPQVKTMDKNLPVILPVAAVEQHGPHLPLATDKMIGEHFCKVLNEEIPDDVVILPTISVGCSEHHMDFEGSLSVRHDTLLRQLQHISGCVVKYGFKNLLILNSHGGNQAIGQTFVETFGFRNPQCRIALATWWRISLEALNQITQTPPGGTGHAGEFETSLMLHIAPDLVQLDKIAVKSNVPTFRWAEGDLLRAGNVSLYRTMKAMTPNGVFGDPSAGTMEKGVAITRVVVKALREIIMDLKESVLN